MLFRSRITFKNLANEGNFLDKFWQDQIWLPPLLYSNTEKNVKILSTNTIIVEVQREERQRVSKKTALNDRLQTCIQTRARTDLQFCRGCA